MRSRSSARVRQSVRDVLLREERVVLAVSGGLDSMALLDAAVASLPSERLLVATFDHGTGPAAALARAFVEARCSALGVSWVSERAVGRLTTEAALREARWTFFRQAARGGAAICTAHTADDQIETVLMRMMRGAGARGLAGLYAQTGVVRPLLSVRRVELARYVREQSLGWVEDPSNASRRHFRNRVRHDLLPALRRVRPAIDDDLLEASRAAASWRAEVEAFVDSHVPISVMGETGGSLALDAPIAALADYDAGSLAVIWPAIAARAGVALDRRGTARLATFCAGGWGTQPGSRIQLAGGWEVVRSRDAFQLRVCAGPVDDAFKATPSRLALSKERATSWNAGAARWSFRPSGTEVGGDSWSAWLPADRPLWIRAWRAGDCMVWRDGFPPRKVKRFLTDAGVSGHERPVWPVVLAGDQIVWIPGVRRSAESAARSGTAGLAFACDYHR